MVLQKDFLERLSVEESERCTWQREVQRVINHLKEKEKDLGVKLSEKPDERSETTSATHVFHTSTQPLARDARSAKSSGTSGVFDDENDDLVILEVVEPQNSNTYPSFGESSVGIPRGGSSAN